MAARDVDVSVIVPCYNTERFLDQALVSAEQNSRCSVEIIVLNDGSSDKSLDIMRTHEARDARVRVIDKQNQGYGATVNRGIAEARGHYVAILEPDDWVLPHMYDELFELAKSSGFPNVVKSCYRRIRSAGASGVEYGYLRGRVKVDKPVFTLADAPQLIMYHPSIWSALYDREFLSLNKLSLREVPGAGWVDNPFCVETLVAARSIAFTDEAYYCYREDLPGASSAQIKPLVMLERWEERQDALDAYGIGDARIRYANCVVGLRFLGQILSAGLLDELGVREAATKMARRMDPELVCTVREVAPAVVACCLELAGADEEAPGKAEHLLHLASEAAWAFKVNGPAFLWHNVMIAKDR
ncbi:MAG: glycosyltransferase [Coriobacteriales bacterium]|nr:glycosyltransferase [Coriobacteriales bacterium]